MEDGGLDLQKDSGIKAVRKQRYTCCDTVINLDQAALMDGNEENETLRNRP